MENRRSKEPCFISLNPSYIFLGENYCYVVQYKLCYATVNQSWPNFISAEKTMISYFKCQLGLENELVFPFLTPKEISKICDLNFFVETWKRLFMIFRT